MSSILGLAKTEGMLFKYGSGTGSNLSSIRGSHEGLSAGGTASGPLSFMKGFDSFAGAIKSGGKTRRAAKMVILNIDHPDVEDFVLSKANEEKKAWALIDAGYDGSFNVASFRHACDVVISAQEMLVPNCSYPTPAIEENSHKFRPLGLGYANLGALLMAAGLPYDSDEGRAYAGAITSLMCGEGYLQSSKIAAELGPFAGYAPNRDAFLDVIGMHRDAATKVPTKGEPAELHSAHEA